MFDRAIRAGALVLLLACACATAFAQRKSDLERRSPHIIIPQVPPRIIPPPMPRPPAGVVRVVKVKATVRLTAQVAVTELLIDLQNDGRSRLEAQLLAPAPEGAVVRAFGFEGAGKELTAKILPRDEARRIYNEIVAKLRDPALLEFAGYSLVRSSVFPVEPRKTQAVRLVYENLLPLHGNRIDYHLPRSESLRYDVPWSIEVHATGARPISTVYSPSHELTVKRIDEKTVTAHLAPNAGRKPGPFRLSILLQESDGVTASVYAYPDPKIGGGYFLLLAGLPADERKRPSMKREVTLVIDRSGSMRGEKIKQVREAALQILAGLEEGEAFNVMLYNDRVDLFAERPVVKNAETMASARKFLAGVKAQGGTNIHDALVECLRQEPTAGMLPIVLFLTDGLPTVGQTSERAIREVAIKGNPHHRRTFTFGVGVDVNTPLLRRVASETRAKATFVLPQEDVEVKVAAVFRNLAGPIMADTALEVADGSGRANPKLVRDIIPDRLPDLFEDDQLILLGQYRGDEPVTFTIRGNYLGAERAFKVTFNPDKATTRNSFVPRLWASRKIAVLESAIRDLGADLGLNEREISTTNDLRMKELISEIVALSTEFGILTEYTAFLAREGADLARGDALMREAGENYARRALGVRSGAGSVNQEKNLRARGYQSVMNYDNSFLDEKLQRVVIKSIQQINDRAFYKRGDRWVDSRLVTRELPAEPSRRVAFGSQEYAALVERLVREGRPGCLSLQGDILLEIDNIDVLVTAP